MVDFRELLCGLSVLCSGATREAKLRFIYKIYDTDRNQTLDADEGAVFPAPLYGCAPAAIRSFSAVVLIFLFFSPPPLSAPLISNLLDSASTL